MIGPWDMLEEVFFSQMLLKDRLEIRIYLLGNSTTDYSLSHKLTNVSVYKSPLTHKHTQFSLLTIWGVRICEKYLFTSHIPEKQVNLWALISCMHQCLETFNRYYVKMYEKCQTSYFKIMFLRKESIYIKCGCVFANVQVTRNPSRLQVIFLKA